MVVNFSFKMNKTRFCYDCLFTIYSYSKNIIILVRFHSFDLYNMLTKSPICYCSIFERELIAWTSIDFIWFHIHNVSCFYMFLLLSFLIRSFCFFLTIFFCCFYSSIFRSKFYQFFEYIGHTHLFCFLFSI